VRWGCKHPLKQKKEAHTRRLSHNESNFGNDYSPYRKRGENGLGHAGKQPGGKKCSRIYMVTRGGTQHAVETDLCEKGLRKRRKGGAREPWKRSLSFFPEKKGKKGKANVYSCELQGGECPILTKRKTAVTRVGGRGKRSWAG